MQFQCHLLGWVLKYKWVYHEGGDGKVNHEYIGKSSKIIATKITWLCVDYKVVEATAIVAPIALQVKPEKLHRGGFLEVEGLNDGWWSSFR